MCLQFDDILAGEAGGRREGKRDAIIDDDAIGFEETDVVRATPRS